MRVWSDSTVPWPGYLTINTYEDGFLTLAEQRITGTLNVVSAAMWGMRWVVVGASVITSLRLDLRSKL